MMASTSQKLKVLMILLVLIALIFAGSGIYTRYQSKSAANAVDQACARAQLHYATRRGTLTELTPDDTTCAERTDAPNHYIPM